MLEVGRGRGHTFDQPDFDIAAAAALHDLVCVIRDIDHFVVAGVPVLEFRTERSFAPNASVITDAGLNGRDLPNRLAQRGYGCIGLIPGSACRARCVRAG